MYFDQRGPFIFSASLHFAVVVFFLIKSMIDPEKPPEELVFILVPPPSSAAPQEERPIEYDAEEFEMPEIPDPEPVIKPEPDPPVERKPERTIPVEEEPKPKPKPAPVSAKDFFRENPVKPQRIPKPQAPKRIDLSQQVDRLQQSLSELNDMDLPSTVLDSISAEDQDKLAIYFAALKQAILKAVKSHPLTGNPLQARVQFNLAATGRISGAVIVARSGDAEFDRKVIDGFGRLGSFRAPPGWTGTESLTMTIKQSDR